MIVNVIKSRETAATSTWKGGGIVATSVRMSGMGGGRRAVTLNREGAAHSARICEGGNVARSRSFAWWRAF